MSCVRGYSSIRSSIVPDSVWRLEVCLHIKTIEDIQDALGFPSIYKINCAFAMKLRMTRI